MKLKKFGLSILLAILLSTPVLAVVVTISANGTLTNKDGNPVAEGSYVQVIQSDDEIPGTPSEQTGLPVGDYKISNATPVSPAGTYNSGASITNETHVYIRVWDSWDGTGTPTGFYGTTIPEKMGGGFLDTYLTSLNQNQWVEINPDVTPPTITSTIPNDGANNVPINQSVSITFSEAMNTSSVSISSSPNPGGWSSGTWSNGDKTVTYTHNNFNNDITYTITVTAAEDPAGNPLSGDNNFSFSTPDTLSPTITSTIPNDGANNVLINQSVSITFSEAMNTSSVSISSSPNPGGWSSGTWSNGNRTITYTHNNFDYNTFHTVTVTAAQDPAGNPLIGDNDFTFATAPFIIQVTSVDIERNGNNIVLSWTTNPQGAGVDIWTKTGYYSRNAADWPSSPELTNRTSSPISESVVGNGTHKFYKVVPTGTAKANVDFSADVYGKFDLAVGPSDTEPNKFFISVPLEVTDASLTALIGNQVTEMDMVITFDINKEVSAGAMYQGGAWQAFPGVPQQITELEEGYTYGYITSVSKNITVTGKVKESNFSRTLNGGMPLEAHWIANPYPTPVGIQSAGLNASSYNSDPTQAAIVYTFDANAELIGGTDGIAFHIAQAEWKEGTLSGPSPMILEPGRGHMFTEPVKASFNWNLNRP